MYKESQESRTSNNNSSDRATAAKDNFKNLVKKDSSFTTQKLNWLADFTKNVTGQRKENDDSNIGPVEYSLGTL